MRVQLKGETSRKELFPKISTPPNFRKPQPQVQRIEQMIKIRVIQLKITSLIRFTQGHEVSVADFYLALGKSKSVCRRVVDIYCI